MVRAIFSGLARILLGLTVLALCVVLYVRDKLRTKNDGQVDQGS